MKPLIFLVGETAVGKTVVALELARMLGAEIVSADSMQVYRGLDILSAKPTLAHQAKVRHHLIDVVEPDEHFDVARYLHLARKAITDIRSRGKIPLVTGGSGMYIRALIDGIFTGPGKDDTVRRRLQQEATECGLLPLYSKLLTQDPERAQAIHQNDRKRIIRALEIIEITGQKASSLRADWGRERAQSVTRGICDSNNLGCRIVYLGLRRNRESLNKRIEERVNQMIKSGAVDEVKTLVSKGLDDNMTICQSLGIKELNAFIKGQCTLPEAADLLSRNTRAFAKRQRTWFRRDERIQWFEIGATETEASVAKRIFAFLGQQEASLN